MSDTLKDWMNEGIRRGARWLIINWDSREREWTRHYASGPDPAPYQCGLETEQFRVDLHADPATSASHVYLAEEP